ncbi:MAG: tetratricopeptide repeat protein [Cyanobacteria bacterium J06598_3]
MIKKFLAWLNNQLRHIPSFEQLRQALFESIAQSCRIRRNPQAIHTLKVIPPCAQPPSRRPLPSSRWSFLKATAPKTKRKLAPREAFPPHRSGQPSPLTDPNNIVYAVPRAEIVDTLNHTLGQTLGQTLDQAPSRPSARTNTHPTLHPEIGPEIGPDSKQASTSRSPHPSEREKNLPARQNVKRRLSSNNLDTPGAINHSINRLERSYANHPDILEELSDSAYLCECQGRYAEAERLYKQVLALKQQRLGPDHLEIATTLNDLAALYCLKNQHTLALPLLKKTLIIHQQHQVASHPDLAETLYQLAKVYRHQAQYGKAEPLFQQALSIFRQQLGGQHPRTQSVYNDLMQMIVTTIEGGKFSELASELPPLDLNTLSDTYSWAKPSWQR